MASLIDTSRVGPRVLTRFFVLRFLRVDKKPFFERVRFLSSNGSRTNYGRDALSNNWRETGPHFLNYHYGKMDLYQ